MNSGEIPEGPGGVTARCPPRVWKVSGGWFISTYPDCARREAGREDSGGAGAGGMGFGAASPLSGASIDDERGSPDPSSRNLEPGASLWEWSKGCSPGPKPQSRGGGRRKGGKRTEVLGFRYPPPTRNEVTVSLVVRKGRKSATSSKPARSCILRASRSRNCPSSYEGGAATCEGMAQ